MAAAAQFFKVHIICLIVSSKGVDERHFYPSLERGPESLSSARVLLEHLLQAPLAVCMGQHTRLGSNSTFFRVDEYVMALIIDMSFEVTPSASSEAGRLRGSEVAIEDLSSDDAAMIHINN